MRISTDRHRCVGAGQCVLSAARLFDQDEDGLVVVRATDPGADGDEVRGADGDEVRGADGDEVRGADGDAVRQAADLCPSGAIWLSED
ncbi:ferredoxin [Actinomadura sp. 9N215]|uniref:ferredoxin n=1 Tax=Actinomadura sp. 9N215 TaxID=3375150 RepID=UPI0037978F24